MHPGAPVSEQLPGLLGIPPFIDALKHQPHLVGHARYAPFKSQRLPLRDFLLSPVNPVLEPHPPSPLQPVQLPSIGPALGLPDLVARLHSVLDDVDFVVHHLSVPKVVAHSLGIGGTHVDGHVLNRLGMPVVPQQFRSKSRSNGGVLTGRSKENPLGHKISKRREVIVPFVPVHLVGSHPNGVVEAQPGMRRFHVGEEHPPHPRVALAEDLSGTLHRHFPHQGTGEGLDLLGEVLAAPLTRLGHTVHLTDIAKASSRQGTHDDALLVEDVEVPLLHRLDMVVAGHRGPGPSTLLRPQVRRFLHLQQEGRGACLKPSLHDTPCLTKPQELSKRILRCHRRS